MSTISTSNLTIDFGSPQSSSSPATATKRKRPAGPSFGTVDLGDANTATTTSATPPCQVVTQFTVLVDSNETIPYTFTGLMTDSDKHHRPLAVVTQREGLGIGWGDYSIRGMEPRLLWFNRIAPVGEILPIISLERKSMEDAHGTFLGFKDGRRDRFERELSQLNGLTFAAVVVECTEGELYANAPEWGQKSKAENAKSLSRTIDSWRMRFNRVQWVFASDRRMAEVKCFRLLEKFWKEHHAR